MKEFCRNGHPEAERSPRGSCRACLRDAGKRFREQHREQVRAASAAYYVLNRARLRASEKQYRARNRDKLQERNASHYKRNKQKIRAQYLVYRQTNPIARIMQSVRMSARTRGLMVQITRADLLPLPTHCPVFGMELDYTYGTKNERRQPNSPSVDRIDNTKGYIPGNVQIISWRANMIKSNATPDELWKVARYVAQVTCPLGNRSELLHQQHVRLQ